MTHKISQTIVAFAMVACVIPLVACEPTSTTTRAAHNKSSKLLKLDDYNRNSILMFVDNLKWLRAKNQYQSIARDKYDLTDINKAIEARLLATLTTLSDKHYSLGIQGYEFLLVLHPDNAEFQRKLTQYQNLKAGFLKAAIDKLKPRTDKIEGITWYSHPDLPQYTAERSGIDLYIGRIGDGPPTLRMKTQYTSKNWLFVDKVLAWHDGVKEPLVEGRFKRNHTGRKIWEWKDVRASKYQIAILESLARSEEAILRFQGTKTRRDITLSKKDKQAYSDVLAAYKAMQESSENERR